MSLINDALKRASSQKPSPGGGAPLQPVATPPARTGPLPIILCLVGIGAFLMAGAFWLKSKATSHSAPPQVAQVAPPSVAKPDDSKPIQTAMPIAAVPPQSAVAPSNSLPTPTSKPQSELPISAAPSVNTAQGPAEAKPAAVPSTSSAQPAPRSASPFRLQAVYFRLKGPTVVINGKTLKIGDTVDGAKLVAIERNGAILDVQGTREKLTMH